MNEFDFVGCVSPVYVVFKTLNGYEFFFDLFRRTEFFKESVLSRAIGGVRQTLNYSDFAMINLVIPPINVIECFNKIYESYKDIIKSNEKQNNNLSLLRDTLLPKLMSGEIEV